MVQQLKAANTATPTMPPTKDDTLWPNTIPVSTNLFDARASWPMPSYMDEVPMPTSVKTEKAKEKTLPKQEAIPHALIKPQNSKPAEQECRWGLQCPSAHMPRTVNQQNKNVDIERDDFLSV